MVLKGGCLCGSVRYEVHECPVEASYCHCTTCRRASGAPVVGFASVAVEAFVLAGVEPRQYRSSEYGERLFCGDCGTQLAMRVDQEPGMIDFTLSSLDEPEQVPPGFHIWTASRIAWFDIRDDLPRYREARPDDAIP